MGAARLRRALCQDLAGNITIGDGNPSPFSYLRTLLLGNEMLSRVQ